MSLKTTPESLEAIAAAWDSMEGGDADHEDIAAAIQDAKQAHVMAALLGQMEVFFEGVRANGLPDCECCGGLTHAPGQLEIARFLAAVNRLK